MRRALLAAAALLLGACVPTEELEASYCAGTHRTVVCQSDADCCTNHRCMPAFGLEGSRCFELGKCIRERVGPNEGFTAGTACSCNDDCLSKRCTNQKCE